MSLCTLSRALDRIAAAEPESPLAVFATESLGRVDVMFANTVNTRKKLMRSNSLIGIFDKTYDRCFLSQTIKNGMNPDNAPTMAKRVAQMSSLKFTGRLV